MTVGLTLGRSAGQSIRPLLHRWQGGARELLGLLATASPIAAVGLMNSAMSVTNMVMMASVDHAALAAGAVVSDVYSIIFQFGAGALSAVTPPIARAHAEGHGGTVLAVLIESFRLGAVIALAGFLLVLLTPALLCAAGVTLPLLDAAEDYAAYMAATFVLMLVVALARSVFPAVGRGSVPLLVMAAAVPVNALANVVFIHGWWGAPEMGLAGSGAASLVVAGVAAGVLLLYALAAPEMRVFWRRARAAALPRPPLGFIKAGILTGLASLCETGVFLSSTVLVGALAAEALPAHVAVFRALAVSYVIVLGYGQAVTIHMARALGSSPARRDMVRRAAIAGGLGLWALSVWALRSIPGLTSVLAPGQNFGGHLALLAPRAGIAAGSLVPSVIAFSILRAQSDISVPTAIGLAGYWIIGFSTMIVLAGPLGHGALGIWIGLAAGTTATAAGSWAYLALPPGFGSCLHFPRSLTRSLSRSLRMVPSVGPNNGVR